MTDNMGYCEGYLNRDWIKYIESDLIDIYPIQFANCDRLLQNDSVYIFDEVGSGKTISSGLMALDYLMNNKVKKSKVLIITTNALAKKDGNEYGQFLRDWYEKLPFGALDLKGKVDVVNNHYSSFGQEEKYGLVIIDEAHLFLNRETLRYQMLTQYIRAEKIVFLTATPIKEAKSDLYIYVDIAERLLEKKDLNREWIDEICTVGKDGNQIICSTFDEKSPVTRYFKDTIMALNIEGYRKTQARRLLPQLWMYDNSNKVDKMIQMIKLEYKKNYKSKFVIFTRFVEREAKSIGRSLEEQGISKFSSLNEESLTYYIVTGQNSFELSKFSQDKELPTILILTYQIAEQGVNLPGYNYVINYHISSLPSSLEQRFGRIDRMGKRGSVFSVINMCFLLSEDRWDTNTANFYLAVSTYLHTLISYLPSKNTILSEQIINKYNQAKSLVGEYIKQIEELCNDRVALLEMKDYFTHYYSNINSVEFDTHNRQVENDLEGLQEENELVKFCLEHDIIYNVEIDEKEYQVKMKKAIREKLLEIKKIVSDDSFSFDLVKRIINEIGDKVFYCKSEKWNINKYGWFSFESDVVFLDAIGGCAQNIYESSSYQKYMDSFKETVKIPLVFAKYKEHVNDFFEKEFMSNRFHHLFPLKGYFNLYQKKIIPGIDSINQSDKELLLTNVEEFTNTLPFFKMCMKFKDRLHSFCWTNKGQYRIKYDFNPFTAAMGSLKYSDFGLSREFYNKYWAGYTEGSRWGDYYINYFSINSNKESIIEASEWYKMSYHFTRKEMMCWAKVGFSLCEVSA